jgi:hypothetical protein
MSPRPLEGERVVIRARRAASAADLRAGSIPDVQLVGGVGPFEVDVLIRVLPTGRIEIVGQVTRAERLQEAVPDLPVLLCDGDTLAVLARTRTNAFGEFDVAGAREGRYALSLGDGPDAPWLLLWEGGTRVEACDVRV